MLTHAKVCPSCHAEYLPQVGRCADCGVGLVWEGDPALSAPPPEPEPAPDLALAEGETLLRETDPRWAVGLAEALLEAGVPCRMGPTPAHEEGRAAGRPIASLPLGVFVAEVDLEAARRVDAAYLRVLVPEFAEVEVVAAGDERSADGCPACGSAVAADAAECPECGLVFMA